MKYKCKMTAKADNLQDRFTGYTFHTGDEMEFEKDRYEELLKGGYVEPIEVKEEIKTATPKQDKVRKAVKNKVK